MTIAGLDSSFSEPSLVQVLSARNAGYRKWSGYVATRSGVGLAHPWPRGRFDVAHECGSTPIGFCSGWDDPVAIRNLCLDWGIWPCLDVESGIRGNGAWVQPWLDACEIAGLYGNHGVHGGRRAPFYILGAYPTSGDPFGASWDGTARPPGPCGWQWAGTHTEFGASVDSQWLDDWFLAGFIGESGMGAISFRPAGPKDRWDEAKVENGRLVRYFGDSIDGRRRGVSDDGSPIGRIDEGKPVGVDHLVAGTAYCNWDPGSGWVLYGAQGSDGVDYEFYGNINNGNISGWGRVGAPYDIPAAKGDKGDKGETGIGFTPEIIADVQQLATDLGEL